MDDEGVDVARDFGGLVGRDGGQVGGAAALRIGMEALGPEVEVVARGGPAEGATMAGS